MTIDIDKIERLARDATHGQWEQDEVHKEVVYHGNWVICECDTISGIDESIVGKANAAYIAAANPAVVLELIAELREKNQLLADIFDDCGGKINDACPVCSTYTHKNWCWYPKLAALLDKPLDEYDVRFLAYENGCFL